MKQILDIGCGTGFRTSRLKYNLSSEVTGIDISNKNIKIAKNRYPEIKFKIMSAEKMLFTDNFFDEVYAVDVLEHVNNLDKTIEEINRVLKKAGKLTVVVPAEKSENWLIKIRPNYLKEMNHQRIFKQGELKSILSKKNYSLNKIKAQNFIEHLELYFFTKTQKSSSTQLQIGDWRKNPFTIIIHAFFASFDPYWVFNTPLKFIPIWLITIPIGFIINFFGNKIMPKSIHYEFIKT